MTLHADRRIADLPSDAASAAPEGDDLDIRSALIEAAVLLDVEPHWGPTMAPMLAHRFRAVLDPARLINDPTAGEARRHALSAIVTALDLYPRWPAGRPVDYARLARSLV